MAMEMVSFPIKNGGSFHSYDLPIRIWPCQALRHYSHIVLDEIHERDLDMDWPPWWHRGTTMKLPKLPLLGRKWCVFYMFLRMFRESVQMKSEKNYIGHYISDYGITQSESMQSNYVIQDHGNYMEWWYIMVSHMS